MLTIKNFDVLKGRSFIMPNQWGYTIIEAGEYVGPVSDENMYVLKLKPSPNYKEVSIMVYPHWFGIIKLLPFNTSKFFIVNINCY